LKLRYVCKMIYSLATFQYIVKNSYFLGILSKHLNCLPVEPARG
jgi:hypothetical protein